MTTRTTDSTKKDEAGFAATTAATENAEDNRIAAESLSTPFPIVGIGASAGGLAAFEAFFSGMTAGTLPGMAFVLVQHLSPDHKSVLAELVGHYTSMEVFEVTDGMAIKSNCIYIIPPGCDLAIKKGSLRLQEPSAPRGKRLPIDYFFRSLAENQMAKAVAIILSGNGSDGTQGIQAINGAGGMVMVQDPASTEHDSMPRNAIATGMVDYTLPPAEMFSQLLEYSSHTFTKPSQDISAKDVETEKVLQKILTILREETGYDFSHYRKNTTSMRIKRRMAVCRIDKIAAYLTHLRSNPAELQALYRDLLMSFTRFFRNPNAFEKLEKEVIPKLFSGKPSGGTIRVWSVGCGSGEEAYSVAILLQEHLKLHKNNYTIQVFATDIDEAAIITARTGYFPANIAADISEERLSRYFTPEEADDGFRIKKTIRDTLTFSIQDVAKDSSFSKIDLILCRNLLIFLTDSLQQKILHLFEYALNPEGFLFLGSSESAGDSQDLFSTLCDSSTLYQRNETLRSAPHGTKRQLSHSLAIQENDPAPATMEIPDQKVISLRQLTEQTLLQQMAPVGILTNSMGDILYIHGRTGRYLGFPQGQARVSNILKMAHQGLQHHLTLTLRKAETTKEIVRKENIKVQNNGRFSMVNLTIMPVMPSSSTPHKSPLYLVTLEETQAIEGGKEKSDSASAFADDEDENAPSNRHSLNLSEASLEELKQELAAKEDYLKSANNDLETLNEELEVANEELKSFNEEMQSINEELQATNEELKTSEEELATVNAELQDKVSALARANNDINNLLAGTGIATVFIDHDQRILSFTPLTKHIFNLRPADVGRPIAHIVSNLRGYERLLADAKAVSETLQPTEIEVQIKEGSWFMMRILPYRTLENVVEGTVLTFVDITEAKKAQEGLHHSEERFRLLLETMPTYAIQGYGLDGTIHYWNKASESLYHYSAAEAINTNRFDLILPAEMHGTMRKIIDEGISSGQKIPAIELEMKRRDGSLVPVYSSHVLLQRADADTELFSIDVDLTKQKEADELRSRNEAQSHRIEKAEGLERMAAAIAHLFNNNLQVMMGNLELALDELTEGEPPWEYLCNTMQAAKRSSEISSLMLTYLGQNQGSLENLDLSEICRLQIPELQNLLPANISLETTLLDSGPVVWARENQIHQVLTRLISNAQEAIGEVEGQVKVALCLLPARDIPKVHIFPANLRHTADNYACLEVSDNGCGIIREEMDKIFDPFYSTKFTGRGLGLAVVMGLVRTWGAMISVQSEVGKGSSFRVFFPLIEDRIASKTEKFAAPVADTELREAILVVDDDDVVLFTLEAVLKRLGFRVFSAENGSKAIELFIQHQESIRCVITDISMPGMNGWELLTALRKIKPNLPIVLASGYDESQAMDGEHDELPQAFLQKPFNIQGLKDILSKTQIMMPDPNVAQ